MKKDVIITGEESILRKKVEENDLIDVVTEMWDSLSADEKIRIGKPKGYRTPKKEIKGRPRKKRRHRR